MQDGASTPSGPHASESGQAYLDVLNHVLRTPLTVVTGYLDLLLDGVLGPLTEEQADALRLAESAARQLEARLASHLSGETLVEQAAPPSTSRVPADW